MSTGQLNLYNEGLKVSRLRAVYFACASKETRHETQCHFQAATGIKPSPDATNILLLLLLLLSFRRIFLVLFLLNQW
jgi:hypothetical protein